MRSAVDRYKIEVRFELAEDGLLRVWSPDVPGFRLAHQDHEAVIGDIVPALETILSDRWGKHVQVRLLKPLSEKLSRVPLPAITPTREYVSEIAA
jgi:hypothetical protein